MARNPKRPLVDADAPRLEGGIAGGAKTIFALEPRTDIGRHPGCTVCLDDREVSGVHCTIELQDVGVTVNDEGSSNGTYVNGRRVMKCRLRDGDELWVGNHHFVARLGRLAGLGAPDDEWERPPVEFPFIRLEAIIREGEQRLKALDQREREVQTQLDVAAGANDLHKLRTASALHQGLGLEPDGAAAPDLLVRAVRQLTGADNVVLFTLDSAGSFARTASARRDEAQDELPISDEVLQRVRAERAAVVSGNLRADPRFSTAEAVVAVHHSVLAVPVVARGQLRGVLHCDSRQRADAFSDLDARIVAGLAAHAALLMEPGITSGRG